MFGAATCKGGGWAQGLAAGPSRRRLVAGVRARPAALAHAACMPATHFQQCITLVAYLACNSAPRAWIGCHLACGAVLLAGPSLLAPRMSVLSMPQTSKHSLHDTAKTTCRFDMCLHAMQHLMQRMPHSLHPRPPVCTPLVPPCSSGSALPAHRHQQLGCSNGSSEWSGLAGGQQPVRRRRQRRMEGRDVWRRRGR